MFCSVSNWGPSKVEVRSKLAPLSSSPLCGSAVTGPVATGSAVTGPAVTTPNGMFEILGRRPKGIESTSTGLATSVVYTIPDISAAKCVIICQ